MSGDFLKKKLDCPICLDLIEPNQLQISSCGDKYCKDCYSHIDQVAICRKMLKKTLILNNFGIDLETYSAAADGFLIFILSISLAPILPELNIIHLSALVFLLL